MSKTRMDVLEALKAKKREFEGNFDLLMFIAEGLPRVAQEGITFRAYTDRIVILIDDIKYLSEARKIAKSLFPKWADEIDDIWNPYGETILVSWGDPKAGKLEIWLSTDVENFPKELLGDGCTIKTVTRSTYSVVCKGVDA